MKEEERKGEIGRGRETRKGGRMKQREKECIAIGLCHPEGEVIFFFFKSVAQETLGLAELLSGLQ